VGLEAFDLTGKVALVTGGNGGIGLGMAEGLAKAGAAVAIWGTNEAKNAAAGEALRRFGVPVQVRKVDVTQEAEVVEGVRAVVEELGRVDAVFANAGIGGGGSFVDMDIALFRKVLAVNLEGVFFTLREAARHMRDRAAAGDPGGSLVVVSSLSAQVGGAGNQPYVASKGAVTSMIRSCAQEFGEIGVRANAILPGWVDTDIAAFAKRDGRGERIARRLLVKRWGQPADFEGIAVYLASDASRFHTGDWIVIDGGWQIS
jgi:NAD(P)-dependent dehydrogenase (short-subunit alcohol dehydrogenase family)